MAKYQGEPVRKGTRKVREMQRKVSRTFKEWGRKWSLAT